MFYFLSWLNFVSSVGRISFPQLAFIYWSVGVIKSFGLTILIFVISAFLKSLILSVIKKIA